MQGYNRVLITTSFIHNSHVACTGIHAQQACPQDILLADSDFGVFS